MKNIELKVGGLGTYTPYVDGVEVPLEGICINVNDAILKALRYAGVVVIVDNGTGVSKIDITNNKIVKRG